MDASKIFTVLCAFLLIICLTLSITALTVLRNAVDENEEWQRQAEILVGNLESFTEDQKESSIETNGNATDSPSVDADILYQRLCIREAGGKIAVYSEDGTLIRTVDIEVKTLPKSEQEALSHGIYVNSWRELISLIQDYE